MMGKSMRNCESRQPFFCYSNVLRALATRRPHTLSFWEATALDSSPGAQLPSTVSLREAAKLHTVIPRSGVCDEESAFEAA